MQNQPKEVALMVGGPHDGQEITVGDERSVVVLTKQTEKVNGKWVVSRSFYAKASAEVSVFNCDLFTQSKRRMVFEFSHTVVVPVKIVKYDVADSIARR